MTTEELDAFWTLETKSRGLEETFLSAQDELVLTEEAKEYAIDACNAILDAIKIIEAIGE